MDKYRILVNGDVVATMEGNFSDAASPLYLDGDCTPFQVADSRHLTVKAARMLLDWADAQGSQFGIDDDAEIDVEPVNVALEEMAEMLERHGEYFTGNHVADMAQEWLDRDFSAETADEWCEIGVWDPATAAALRNAGLSAKEAEQSADALRDDEESEWDAIDDAARESNPCDWTPCDRDSRFTDGSPIYAACNNDLDVSEIIDKAKGLRR